MEIPDMLPVTETPPPAEPYRPTVDYMLRALDRDLWQTFKARTVREGFTMKGILLRLVRLYLHFGIHDLEAAMKGKRRS